jgi:hypothetical protein
MFIARFNVQSSEALIEKIDIKNISTFSYDKINSSDISLHVPIGTDLSDIELNFQISKNSSMSPDPSSIHDYRSEVDYTVTSEDTKVIHHYRIKVIADLENQTNISNTTGNSFSIYPNPVGQTLQINVPENFGNNIEYTIRSLDGRILQEGKINNNLSLLDISDLIQGVYFITISNKSQQISNKFVKL